MKKVGPVVALAAVVALILAGGVPAKQKFYGTVELMPAGGLVGEWVISGRTMQVVPDTTVKEKHGPLKVGAHVEVEGLEYEGKFIATEIETKKRM